MNRIEQPSSNGDIETCLAQADVLEGVGLEDLEVAESSVADVLHVVTERGGDVTCEP